MYTSLNLPLVKILRELSNIFTAFPIQELTEAAFR